MSAFTAFTVLFAGLAAFGIPIAAMLWFRPRGATWKQFAVGAVTFILSALVLEGAFNFAVFLSPAGRLIQDNIWLLALYGGLAAGIFEETGRLVAFRFLLKEDRPITAVGYGLGHGGIEAILLVGLSMVLNFIVGTLVNAGMPLPQGTEALAETLRTTPAGMFLWAILERVAAVAIHVANSVLVFAALRQRRYRLYAAAVGLHALANLVGVACSQLVGTAAAELVVLAVAAGAVYLARRVYHRLEAGVGQGR